MKRFLFTTSIIFSIFLLYIEEVEAGNNLYFKINNENIVINADNYGNIQTIKGIYTFLYNKKQQTLYVSTQGELPFYLTSNNLAKLQSTNLKKEATGVSILGKTTTLWKIENNNTSCMFINANLLQATELKLNISDIYNNITYIDFLYNKKKTTCENYILNEYIGTNVGFPMLVNSTNLKMEFISAEKNNIDKIEFPAGAIPFNNYFHVKLLENLLNNEQKAILQNQPTLNLDARLKILKQLVN